jgi:hypothetical protein
MKLFQEVKFFCCDPYLIVVAVLDLLELSGKLDLKWPHFKSQNSTVLFSIAPGFLLRLWSFGVSLSGAVRPEWEADYLSTSNKEEQLYSYLIQGPARKPDGF